MMQRNEIITHYYNSREVDDAIYTCNGNEDTKQNLFLVLLNLPEAELLRMHEANELRFYIIRILMNFRNTESRQKKHCEFVDEGLKIDEDNEHWFKTNIAIVEKKLVELKEQSLQGYYMAEVFHRYVKAGSMSKAAKELNITKASVFYAVKKVREQFI